MKMKLLSLLLTAAVMSAAALSGCSSGGDVASSQSGSAAKADVSLSVVFPGSGGASKSLIPAGTQVIEVYASSNPIPQDIFPGMPIEQLGTLIATLTPAAPSTTVQMVPGNYYIGAFAFDADSSNTSRRVLSVAMTGGTIVTGANSVELTFVEGTWTFKDAAGGPLTLSDGTVLKDMVVGGEFDQPVFKKGAIDFSKPVGFGFGPVRLRFSNNTSARTFGGIESQFIGTQKTNRLFTDSYNITRKCSSFDSFSSCNDRKGDHVVLVTSGPEDDLSDFLQEDVKQGNAVTLLGNTVFNPAIPANFFADTSLTNGTTMSGNMLEIVATTDRTVSVKTGMPAKVTAGVKAVSANTKLTGITVTERDYALYNPSGGTNVGNWQLFDARTTSDGKTFYESGFLNCTPQSCNAGDYTFGLVPATSNVGEYCHVFDFLAKSCSQQLPGTGDVYYPWNFYDLNANGVIDYGSFTFNFHLEEKQTYDVFKYLFTATGK